MTTNNETSNVLISMLIENTGKHFLDSGDHYGRNWEKNQEVEFKKQTLSTLSFKYGIEFSYNVYPWLMERIEFVPIMNELFETFCKEKDLCPDLEGMSTFVHGVEFFDFLSALLENFEKYQEEYEFSFEIEDVEIIYWNLERQDGELKGIYGEGEPVLVNTYNGPDLLSQTLQYVYFELDGEGYYLLQIHGGCDVRGGYTDAKVFTENGDYSELSLFDNVRGVISVDQDDLDEFNKNSEDEYYLDNELCWSTDDAYHWYCDGSFNDLETYETSDNLEDKGKGKIYVDEDGNGYCPITGCRLVG